MKQKVSILNEIINAPSVIRECKLRWGYFIGGLIGIVIFAIVYFLASFIGEKIFLEIKTYFNLDNGSNIIYLGIISVVRVLLILVYYFFFRTILLIILSPFLSYFSEKVEKTLNGVEYSFSFRDNIRFIKRGIVIALKNFFKEIFFTIIIAIVGFFPLFSIFVPILLFLIQSYFIGYSFIDYTLERSGFNEKESNRFVKSNIFSTTLGGAVFTFIYFIPVIGIFIAPLIMVVSFTTLTLKSIQK